MMCVSRVRSCQPSGGKTTVNRGAWARRVFPALSWRENYGAGSTLLDGMHQ